MLPAPSFPYRAHIMVRGRRPLGPGIAQHLEGSVEAKDRLEILLATLTGHKTIPQACQELRVSHSRFHELRSEVLQQAIKALEPRPRGRPPNQVSQEDARTTELQQQVQSLTADLRASQIREQMAIMLPRLGKKRPPDAGKKS
jgi:hypothetical protein